MSGWLVVFAKAPRPGAVKTRMTPQFDPECAAALYAALLDDVLEASAAAAARLDLAPVLAVHPPDAVGELARRAPAGFRAIAQHGQGLARRMARVLAQAGAAGAWPVLMRGSDSPALDLETLEAARAALAQDDLVLCPDRDGGYNLVGLARPAPGLFSHAMSTPRVLDDTLANAERLGLRSRVLPPGFDLDTFEDLEHLARARRREPAPPCPRPLAFLDERGLWPT